MENESSEVLLIDEEFAPAIAEDEVVSTITEEECEAVKPIMKDFMEHYTENKDVPVEEWLNKELQNQLPDKTSDEIQSMTNEIVETIRTDEANKASLEEAIKSGRDKESWFAAEMEKATSAMSTQEAVQYLNELDNALLTANESLYNTITTQSGVINQNPRLEGFIAEQYHAQTFNLNAEAKGSPYRAKVLEPNVKGYTKNSVDVVIVDGDGKIVKKYQSKYCKNASATEQAFEKGDYRGQQKLVPEEQQSQIHKKSTSVIESPDGVTSNPLSKSQAEQMRDEAQSGKWNDLNWNEYNAKDLAKGIGKQAGYAALQGAVISAGMDVAQKVWNGEEIKGEEVVDTALRSGADFGVKAATAGAIKVGVEKNIIKVIPKGTPASTISNIAFVSVENAKVMRKVAEGEFTVEEGLEKIEQTTVSTVVGLKGLGKGAALGSAIGVIFGPVGAAIGGFVGGSVGYMAGSKVGEKIATGVQKIRHKAVEKWNSTKDKISGTINKAKSGIKNAFRSLRSLLPF